MKQTLKGYTKTELLKIYKEQKSMNRITNPVILGAIDDIKSDMARGFDVKLTQKNIIETAFFRI